VQMKAVTHALNVLMKPILHKLDIFPFASGGNPSCVTWLSYAHGTEEN
jgi:hypothetical protein